MEGGSGGKQAIQNDAPEAEPIRVTLDLRHQ